MIIIDVIYSRALPLIDVIGLASQADYCELVFRTPAIISFINHHSFRQALMARYLDMPAAAYAKPLLVNLKFLTAICVARDAYALLRFRLRGSRLKCHVR